MNASSRRNEIAIQVKVPWTNEETELSGKHFKKLEFAHSTDEVGEFKPEEDPAEGRDKSKTLVWDTTGITYVHKTNLHGICVNETEKDSQYFGSSLSEIFLEFNYIKITQRSAWGILKGAPP